MRSLFCAFTFLLLSTFLCAQSAVAPSSGDGTSGNPYQIATWQNLYWISQNSGEWGKHYLQTADIDFSIADPAITTWNGNHGWTPIGNATTPFTGVYDGGGHKIENLYLYYPGAGEPTTVVEAQALPGSIGLFGYICNSTTADVVIKNLGITNADVTGGRGTGTLVGRVLLPSNAAYVSLIENCYAINSTVRGFGATGGLVGANNTQKSNRVPKILYCYANVTGESRFPTNTIANPDDNGEIFNIKYGGLAGCNENGLSMDSYARGNVYGGKRVGGVSGCSIRGAVIRCYATGQARTGFAGPPFTANADPFVGGIVGRVEGQLPPGLGGFQGSGSIQMCYWDTQTSGNTTSGGGSGAQGRTTAQMQTQSTYTDWNFNGVWLLAAGQYPRLAWQDDVNINPLANTYEGMLVPTVVTQVAQPNGLYSTDSVGGHAVYAGFMPSASETVNVSIYAIYSENPDMIESDFPHPENLGGYWKFYCSDDDVLLAAQYFDIQLPVEYTQLWYRYSRDTTEILPWSIVPDGAASYVSGAYIYRVTISGLNLPTGRSDAQGVLEFAGDQGGGDTLPVELSSFTAVQTAENFARLTWVTQSENDMAGYYVYRGTTDDAAAAVRANDDIIQAANEPGSQTYAYTDTDVTLYATYRYWLESVELNGSCALYGPVTIMLVPGGSEQIPPDVVAGTALYEAYPNPFNPSTTLSFNIPQGQTADITIYNLNGRRVRQWRNLDASHRRVVWDGRDENGNPVGSGVYFYRLHAGQDELVRKMILIK